MFALLSFLLFSSKLNSEEWYHWNEHWGNKVSFVSFCVVVAVCNWCKLHHIWIWANRLGFRNKGAPHFYGIKREVYKNVEARCNSGAVDFKEILDHYYREYARGVVSCMCAYYGGKPIVTVQLFLPLECSPAVHPSVSLIIVSLAYTLQPLFRNYLAVCNTRTNPQYTAIVQENTTYLAVCNTRTNPQCTTIVQENTTVLSTCRN